MKDIFLAVRIIGECMASHFYDLVLLSISPFRSFFHPFLTTYAPSQSHFSSTSPLSPSPSSPPPSPPSLLFLPLSVFNAFLPLSSSSSHVPLFDLFLFVFSFTLISVLCTCMYIYIYIYMLRLDCKLLARL